jgi:hypothetical protein
MEKDRGIAERRDVIVRKVLDDMFALQRKRLGIVRAKLVACVALPPERERGDGIPSTWRIMPGPKMDQPHHSLKMK